MINKLNGLLIGLAMSGSLAATASTMDFTYAQGELFGYGQGKKENIDVAMCINNSTLQGMKIIKIKAYITTVEGIENTSVWLSNDLTLIDKVNVPDIASYEVTPVTTDLSGMTLGLLSIDLPEPVVIGDSPIYIGYSMTVSDVEQMEQKYPIVLSDGANPDGLYLHMNKSVLKWMDYTSKAKGVAFIVATLEGDFNEFSLAVRGSDIGYVLEDEPFGLEINVSNNGSNPVNSLTYTYSFDDSPETFSGSVSLPAPIAPDVTLTWPVTLNFNGIEGIGRHALNVTVTEVDGNENSSPYNSFTAEVNVMPYKPIHRPLVEEFTGLWCGWCPRGYISMEMLGEIYGDNWVGICYHSQDAMTVTAVYPVEFEGYPNSSLNRVMILDPYYGTYNENVDFGIYYDVENARNELTMADIDVDAYIDGTQVYVNSSTKFMIDMDNANYQIGYVLVCNGLFNTSWAQVNNYAGLESEYQGTYLEEICEMSTPIRGLVFNDVAVDVAGMSGVEGSLPQTIKIGESYTHQFSYDIEGNSLVQDPAKLVVCAVVIDKKTGSVINANKCQVKSGTSGLSEIDTEKRIVDTRYYDLTGRQIAGPTEGVAIRQDILSDGTTRTRKILKAQ